MLKNPHRFYSILCLLCSFLILAGCASTEDIGRMQWKIERLQAEIKELRKAQGLEPELVYEDGETGEIETVYFEDQGTSNKAYSELLMQVQSITTSLQALTNSFEETQYSSGKTSEDLIEDRNTLTGQIKDLEVRVKELAATISASNEKLAQVESAAITQKELEAAVNQLQAELVQVLSPEEPEEEKEATPLPAKNLKDTYMEARKVFELGNYENARELFLSVLNDFPENEYSDNARFWIGETYYRQKRYGDAILIYEDLFKKNPKSDKVPDALFKQGLAFYELKEEDIGGITLKKLIKKYPDSKQARTAEEKLEPQENRRKAPDPTETALRELTESRDSLAAQVNGLQVMVSALQETLARVEPVGVPAKEPLTQERMEDIIVPEAADTTAPMEESSAIEEEKALPEKTADHFSVPETAGTVLPEETGTDAPETAGSPDISETGPAEDVFELTETIPEAAALKEEITETAETAEVMSEAETAQDVAYIETSVQEAALEAQEELSAPEQNDDDKFFPESEQETVSPAEDPVGTQKKESIQIKSIGDMAAPAEEEPLPEEKITVSQTETIQQDSLEEVEAKEPASLVSTDFPPSDIFRKALRTFKNKRYEEARRFFRSLLENHPESEPSANAWFWIGETYYRQESYGNAILAYDKFFVKNPNSNKLPEALLRQGMAFYALNNKPFGDIVLEKLIKKFPGSEQARIAGIRKMLNSSENAE